MRAEENTGSANRGQKGLRALGFGLVLLGMCVFAWGLRYKLSLYEPAHAAAHHMVAAKLLPGKERSALPVLDLRRADSRQDSGLRGLSFIFVLLLGAMLFRGFFRWTTTFVVAVPQPVRIAARAHFTRPPPRLR
jgi:hypothetical protein